MPNTIWPVKWAIDTTNLDPQQMDVAEKFAGAVLRQLTGRRVGNIPVTVMPCARTCKHPRNAALGNPFHPILMDTGQMANCFCNGSCSCESAPSVYLDGPVGSIVNVMIDGVALDPSAYRMENGSWLVRTDGDGWPACAGLDFTVTYMNGLPVDLMGQIAAGVLAEEYLKLLNTDKKCRLPSGVKSLNRAGVSIEIETGMFPGNVTGIKEVDTYLYLINPNALRVPPSIHSVDRRRNRQVTWRA